MWLTKWIQTLFTSKFNFEFVVKFWDILIINGIDYILLIILLIIEFFGNKIKKINSLEEFVKICDDIYQVNGYDFFKLYNFMINKIKLNDYKKLLK